MEREIDQNRNARPSSRPHAPDHPKPLAGNAARALPVDLLRIFAASAIFYYHGGLFAGWPLSQWGEFAVATFIYLTAYCTVRYSGSVRGSFWTYWWSRFKAIYPTFAIISLIIFAANFLYAPPKIGTHYTLADLAADLLMISQYIGKPWMTASMWFVPFVLQIYLILPFIVKLPARFYIMPAAFLISGIACAVVYLLLPYVPAHSYVICKSWSPLFRLPEVLFGCFLARARGAAAIVRTVAAYVAYCGSLALLTFVYPADSSILLLPFQGVMVFLVLAGVTAVGLPMIQTHWSGIIALLGRAAFPFWLLHGPGVTFMGENFGRSTGPWILYFVLCWTGSILFTLALDKLQERFSRQPAATS